MKPDMATRMGFGNTELELLMRDMFIFGLSDSKMQGRLLEEDATDKTNTFDKMFKLALSRESSEQQLSVKSEPIANIFLNLGLGQTLIDIIGLKLKLLMLV